MEKKLGKRRLGRESALQFLYQIDLSSGLPDSLGILEAHMIDFFEHFEVAEEISNFASVLLRGIIANREHIDGTIKDNLDNWRFERLDKIDRTVLRIAVFELFFAKELNKSIILNEAIELAKKFGSERSASFVNGVLDRIAKKL